MKRKLNPNFIKLFQSTGNPELDVKINHKAAKQAIKMINETLNL